MTYSSPRTWAASDTPTAAMLNQDLRDNVSFLANVPRVRVYNSALETIPNDTWTFLTYNSERWDTDTIHSTATNTSRLTCKTAGLYRIFATNLFSSNATGWRASRFYLNGATEIYAKFEAAVNGTFTGMLAYTEYVLAVNDYVECWVRQNSGGDLNINSQSAYSPEFGMTWASL